MQPSPIHEPLDISTSLTFHYSNNSFNIKESYLDMVLCIWNSNMSFSFHKPWTPSNLKFPKSLCNVNISFISCNSIIDFQHLYLTEFCDPHWVTNYKPMFNNVIKPCRLTASQTTKSKVPCHSLYPHNYVNYCCQY